MIVLTIGFVSVFFALEWLKPLSPVAYVVVTLIGGIVYTFYTYKVLDQRIQISNLIKSKIKK